MTNPYSWRFSILSVVVVRVVPTAHCSLLHHPTSAVAAVGADGATTDDRLGVWITTNFNYMPNRRGGLNLIYAGYLYTSERKYNSTVNWVCNKNSNLNLKCPARCVTSGEHSIKLSKKMHNHEPIFDPQQQHVWFDHAVGGGGDMMMDHHHHHQQQQPSSSTTASMLDVGDLESWIRDC